MKGNITIPRKEKSTYNQCFRWFDDGEISNIGKTRVTNFSNNKSVDIRQNYNESRVRDDDNMDSSVRNILSLKHVINEKKYFVIEFYRGKTFQYIWDVRQIVDRIDENVGEVETLKNRMIKLVGSANINKEGSCDDLESLKGIHSTNKNENSDIDNDARYGTKNDHSKEDFSSKSNNSCSNSISSNDTSSERTSITECLSTIPQLFAVSSIVNANSTRGHIIRQSENVFKSLGEFSGSSGDNGFLGNGYKIIRKPFSLWSHEGSYFGLRESEYPLYFLSGEYLTCRDMRRILTYKYIPAIYSKKHYIISSFSLSSTCVILHNRVYLIFSNENVLRSSMSNKLSNDLQELSALYFGKNEERLSDKRIVLEYFSRREKNYKANSRREWNKSTGLLVEKDIDKKINISPDSYILGDEIKWYINRERSHVDTNMMVSKCLSYKDVHLYRDNVILKNDSRAYKVKQKKRSTLSRNRFCSKENSCKISTCREKSDKLLFNLKKRLLQNKFDYKKNNNGEYSGCNYGPRMNCAHTIKSEELSSPSTDVSYSFNNETYRNDTYPKKICSELLQSYLHSLYIPFLKTLSSFPTYATELEKSGTIENLLLDLYPFELAVLETVIIHSFEEMNCDISSIEDQLNQILVQEKRKKEKSGILLDNFNKIKTAIDIITDRVRIYHNTFFNLTNDTNYHLLYKLDFSLFYVHPELFEYYLDDEIVNNKLETLLEHVDQEMIYFRECAQQLKQRILNEEGQLNMKLSVDRNRIMFIELAINVLELGISVGTCISGALGIDPDWIGGIRYSQLNELDNIDNSITFRNFLLVNSAIILVFVLSAIFLTSLKKTLRT